MAIFNLGSINIDYVYRLDSLPLAGETVAAQSLIVGLGGKGANQSIAIAKSGGNVRHIGAIGEGTQWATAKISDAGVDVSQVKTVEAPTGHAIINVNSAAENAIVLLEGANGTITTDQIDSALDAAAEGDWLLLQNETNNGLYAAQTAQALGMKVAYSAAPFSKEAVAEILPYADLLAVNEIENEAIRTELPEAAALLSKMLVLVTKGAAGAECIDGTTITKVPAFKVAPVDTTGAGDTFLGYFLASLDSDASMEEALKRAAAASAIQVTREGAADAIPDVLEVTEFMEQTL